MSKSIFARALILAIAALVTSYTPPAFADAAATYKAKCALCHGADGKGDTPAGKKMGAQDFASPEIQKASDADLIAATTKGKNKMPAYGGKLSDADIKELVGYIRQFAKGK
ncbi:MAG TPA: cytochrome c [Candidatus Sulfotelmatobacter sp.]